MQQTLAPVRPIRVLMIEDVENDALLIADVLTNHGIQLDWSRVDTEKEVIAAMSETWDIVFSDFSMPSFSGTRALEILRQYDSDLPFIFVSGTIGEEAAVEAMKAGAQDYVMKTQLTRLPPTIARELREVKLRREKRQAEQALRKMSIVLEQAADSVCITNPEGLIEYVNPAFEKLTGYSANEVKGRTPAILRSGKHDIPYYQSLWQTIKCRNIFRGDIINRHKSGALFYEEKVITPLTDEQGNISHFVATGRDITARIKAEQEHAQLAAILEATPDLVATLELNGSIRYINGAGRRLLGLNSKEVVEGRRIEEIFPLPMAQQLIAHALPAVACGGSWTGETILPIDGAPDMPLSQVVLAHRNNSGEIEYISTIGRDLSERKRFEDKLQHQATHDSLTNLPNRFFLIDRFISVLEQARRQGGFVAVLFLDMDDFKRVNDTLGHASGDALLQQVACRLRNCLRPNDAIARHGGDEFTIVIGGLERAEDALAILRKLRNAFTRSIIVSSHEVYVTFSTGIALYPHDGHTVDDLLRHADTAMYQAKSSGSNQYRFYAPDMNARGHELLALEADLRRALEHKEFLLYYQPQLDLQRNRIIGVEGLLRWQHPIRGLVAPTDFIPLLENSSLIIQVGEWVLRQACIVHRHWRKAGLQNLRVSVNVSAAQFNDEDLLGKIERALREENMPANTLELEITENIIMRDPEMATTLLQALSALGVRTAIDDFGTGYSSLAYLKRFPLNVLKIDRTFVNDLTKDHNDAVIVEASISLARKLGLEVVAEGVETVQQLEFLRSNKCDFAQGYYLHYPMPEADLLKILRHNCL